MDVANYDFGRVGKRVVEYIWDPVPKNDDTSGGPLWCLGRRYESPAKDTHSYPSPSSSHGSPPTSAASRSEASSNIDESRPYEDASAAGDVDSSQSTDCVADEAGWPTAFLDDFEARMWLTYRSNFPPIPRSQDPKASAVMSFSVRLRSQFGSQEGFTNDTGWGCMIRSGQSLLANTLSLLHLGRGMTPIVVQGVAANGPC
jgi:cysteine protease ATG4